MPSLPTHLSAPARRRAIVAVVILALFTVAFIGYQRWRINHPSEETYQKTVSAFYSGVTAMNVGDDPNVVPQLLLATQYAPSEPAAWADLGLYELRKSNFDPARQYLEKAHDLAPKNGRIEAMLGQLDDKQGRFDPAVAHYRQAIALDPGDFRARYGLVQALAQQREVGGDAEVQQQLQAILATNPGNIFVLFELMDHAISSGNADLFRQMTAQLIPASTTWKPEILQDFKAVQALAAASNPRAARAAFQGMRNQVTPLAAYRQAHNAVEALDADGNALGLTPLERFVVLPTPPNTPAAPDMALSFAPQPLPGADPAAKGPLVRLLNLSPETPNDTNISVPPTPAGPPVVLRASGQEVQVQSTRLLFPGGASQTPPTPDGVLTVDWNNDFKPDLVFAAKGALKFLKQGPNAT
ncbi:MAG: tetratricopeptide repeat protein, partial [Armatimonadota bacterium]|nr:tetratricopeptide repeat protein [Armatimonadota bacterium]